MLGEWLKAELKRAQMRQTDLARALSSRLGHRIDRATVNKMISGRRAIAADELLLMANILGVEVPSLDGEATGCSFANRCPYAQDRCRRERPELESRAGRQAACHRADELNLISPVEQA